MANLGKSFEANFKSNWKKCFPNGFIFRLQDLMSGYKDVSQNPCDFICFENGRLFLVECKETAENTLNFSKIRQFKKLCDFIGIKDVYPGVLIWFSSHDKVIWVDASELVKMQNDGKKSVNIKMLEQKQYNILDFHGELKRVFVECDYHLLTERKL